MTRFEKFVAVSLFAMSLAVVPIWLSKPVEAKPPSESWVLVQTSQLYGPIKLFLTPSALKAVARDFTVLACAPTWKVCVYNNRNQMFEIPLDRWAETGLQPMWGPKASKDKYDISKLAISGTCKISNMPCKCVTIKPSSPNTSQHIPGLSQFGSNVKNATWSAIETCVTQSIHPVQQMYPFIRGLRKTAEWTNCVVMRSTHTYSNGKKMLELDTLSCKRQAVPDAELKYPKYRIVSGVQEVIQTRATRESLEDIFGSVVGK